MDHTGAEMDGRATCWSSRRASPEARSRRWPRSTRRPLTPSSYPEALALPRTSATMPQWLGDKDKLLVEPSLERAVAAFAAQGKPIGLCCIAPVIVAALLPGVRVTVGCAEGKQWPYGGTVGAVKAYGGVHKETGADGVCVDASRKVVTSCAYMFAGAPHEIY